jgi:hypothetical protein
MKVGVALFHLQQNSARYRFFFFFAFGSSNTTRNPFQDFFSVVLNKISAFPNYRSIGNQTIVIKAANAL